MTTDGAVELFRNAIIVCCLISGPALMAALIAGLIVGVLQAATQVNEASISFVAKLLAVGITFAILGSWSMNQMVEYTTRAIQNISDVTR
ncbi:MAG TPA: flagellar biosynthetic protein FliQ [Lacunisphaera sp.]|jgi:flagellar biosynthesis protein FliQ|nr:flagellar biosynthetic protein FliQ [Lacunisphaera sp.]HEX2874280.1 flagellar biosynthetic protein FliQ [Polyangiaceae bacterium]